jgi:hypothetical protein
MDSASPSIHDKVLLCFIHTIYPGYWRNHLNSDLAPGRSSRIGLCILHDSGKLQETLKNLNMEASTNGGVPQ